MTLQQFLTKFVNDDMSSIKTKSLGLCVNIEAICYQDSLIEFVETFPSWEHFSGSLTYPIIDESSNRSIQQQYFMENLYEGKQLELRKDLAQHALNVLYNGEHYKLTIIDKLLRRK